MGEGGQRYIINIPGRGYSFVGKVTSSDEARVREHEPAEEAIRSRRTARLFSADRRRSITSAANCYSIVWSRSSAPEGSARPPSRWPRPSGCRPQMPDGIYFIDLAPLTDPALVPSALAAALGIAVRSEGASRNLASVLGQKHLLIVLDNCEHVVEAAAVLAENVASAPNARYSGDEPGAAARRR